MLDTIHAICYHIDMLVTHTNTLDYLTRLVNKDRNVTLSIVEWTHEAPDAINAEYDAMIAMLEAKLRATDEDDVLADWGDNVDDYIDAMAQSTTGIPMF